LSLLQKGCVLIGEPWRNVIGTFFDQLSDYVSERNRKFITFASDPQNAFDLIIENTK